jgi:hypothetical protein
MSRFSNEIARRLAKNAFRYRVSEHASPEEQAEKEQANGECSAPLLAKQDELLDALLAAENIYDQCLQEFLCLQKVRELNSSFPINCQTLKTHLERALACWERMGDSQFELTLRASDCTYPNPNVQHFDQMLRQMLACAEVGAQEQRFTYRGRPQGIGNSGVFLLPLEEFVKSLRLFWIAEVSRVFGFDATDVEKIGPEAEITEECVLCSAAARLVWDAVRILDSRCTIGNVKEVMEAVHANPEFRLDING